MRSWQGLRGSRAQRRPAQALAAANVAVPPAGVASTGAAAARLHERAAATANALARCRACRRVAAAARGARRHRRRANRRGVAAAARSAAQRRSSGRLLSQAQRVRMRTRTLCTAAAPSVATVCIARSCTPPRVRCCGLLGGRGGGSDCFVLSLARSRPLQSARVMAAPPKCDTPAPVLGAPRCADGARCCALAGPRCTLEPATAAPPASSQASGAPRTTPCLRRWATWTS
jgi:hypothetical protein